MASQRASPNTASASASITIKEAVERFKATVTRDDQNQIENSKIDDVIKALGVIQKDLLQRRENRNLRKVYHFAQGLAKYSGAIEVLSNGLSPYLPWIWAPIKLMLQITSDHMSAFDKLIEAYGRIAETLPRLDALADAFKNSPTLMDLLALYYADVLEFHRRAYKFVRRKAWKNFFMTMWAGFDIRFDSILASMARHSDLISQEATTIDIVEAKQWRERAADEAASKEEERLYRQRSSVESWLDVKYTSQADECDLLLRGCDKESCNWFMEHSTVKSWLRVDKANPLVWLHGKPGAGKSVICANLLKPLENHGLTTLYYFCKHHEDESVTKVLKTLALKLIKLSPDLIAVAFSNFVEKNRDPSRTTLRTLLKGTPDTPGLLQGVSPCRIVIDGVDECEASEQNDMIGDLVQLVATNPQSNCKLMICSRDVPRIRQALQKLKKPKLLASLSLSEERESVSNTIQAFAKRRMQDLMDEKPSLRVDSTVVDEVTQAILEKSDGMFLWAKLVLDYVSEADSTNELFSAVTTMPQELPELYGQIIEKLCQKQPKYQTEKIMRMLAWATFARRPLKRHEVLHGVAITPEVPVLDRRNILDDSAVNKCKPMVEELPDGSITLIHFTAQEYLIDRFKSEKRHSDVSFSCMAVLKESLVLVHPSTSETDKFLRVLDGSHALLPYAVEFWLEHLLDCASTTTWTPGSPLDLMTASFHSSHTEAAQQLNRAATRQIHSQAVPDTRLSTLSDHSIVPLCASFLAFRESCKAYLSGSGKDFEAVFKESDPTLLSKMASEFNKCVHKLLSLSEWENVSKERLVHFQDQYKKHAFRCRFPPCTDASLGFPTELERDSHEARHVKLFFCDKPDCFESRIGFQRQRQLEKHIEQHHKEGSIRVPPRVRRETPQPPRHVTGNHVLTDTSTGQVRKSSLALPLGPPQEQQLAQVSHPASDHAQAQTAFARHSSFLRGRSIPESYVKRLGDWEVRFNPKLPRVLDVDLVLKLPVQTESKAMCFSPDGKYLAINCATSTQIYDMQTGERIIFRRSISSYGTSTICFTLDGKHLIATYGKPQIDVWDIQFCAVRKTFAGHGDVIESIAIAGDNRTIASGSFDETVRLWDLENRRHIFTFTAGHPAYSVAFSPDTKYVAAGLGNGSVLIWDIQSRNLVERLDGLDGHQDIVFSVVFSSNGKDLFSGSADKTIKRWELASARGIPNQNKNSPCVQTFTGHQDEVTSVAITPDSLWGISASRKQGVLLWDESGNAQVQVKLKPRYSTQSYFVAVSPTGGHFAASSGAKTCIWSYGRFQSGQ